MDRQQIETAFFDAQEQLDAAAAGDKKNAALKTLMQLADRCEEGVEAEAGTAPPPAKKRRKGKAGGGGGGGGSSAPPYSVLLSAIRNRVGEHYMDACMEASGQQELRGDDRDLAELFFEGAVEANPRNHPAHLSLISLQRDSGAFRTLAEIAARYEAAAAAADEVGGGGGGGSGEEWEATWVEGPNEGCRPVNAYQRALLYAQMRDGARLRATLARFDVGYLLSDEVWEVCGLAREAKAGSAAAGGALGKRGCVAKGGKVNLRRGVVPPVLRAQIRAAFSPASAYWKATGYSGRGYFSFFYNPAEKPRMAIEEAIQHVIRGSGLKAGAVKATEWWVHTRMGARDLGHQLHFDTEEKTLEAEGRIVHPLKSCVVYLTGGETGGLTLCIEQTIRTPTDAEVSAGVGGYAVQPATGATLYFDGSLLHGVLPSGAVGAAAEDAGTASTPPPQRLTLMVALWGHAAEEFAAPKEEGAEDGETYVGPQAPLPTGAGWLKPLQLRKAKGGEDKEKVEELDVYRVAKVWDVLKRGEVGGDGSEELMDVPRSIDQRYFVPHLDFEKALLEDHCGGDDEEEEEEEMEAEEGEEGMEEEEPER
eukprot:Rhum_TRINITY_DN12426_c0_g1::Rhum_TRINITY_DN12426_c0_g1_i1::g.51810::m.51810